MGQNIASNDVPDYKLTKSVSSAERLQHYDSKAVI